MQTINSTITTVIKLEGEKPSEVTVKSAQAIGQVILLCRPGITPTRAFGVKHITAAPSIPAALNHILGEIDSDFLVVAPDSAVISPRLPQFLPAVEKDAGFIYGDYNEITSTGKSLKEVYSGSEDITERAELGPIAIYRTTFLRKLGGWKEELKFAFDYDLRLRMAEVSGLSRIPHAICEFTPPAAGESPAKKLFFPGQGKYGGFSYLFMQPEEEREIESVFIEALKRRGAYLSGDAPSANPEPSQSPLVSVITPVFNREKFIGQTIESVLRGEFRDFEHIIIDNGSIDSTVKVVEEYLSDPRIRLIRNDDNRIAYSLNLGINAARGKYISQLDSDDLYTPRTLKAMTEYMEETGCALAISYYSLINEAGEDLPEFGVIKHLEYNRNNILRVDGAGAVRMWRRSVMLEFGGFDEDELCDYGEDYDLVLKVGEKYSVGRVKEVLYNYRRHPDNSDIRRDPLFKLRNKNLARERAIKRRKLFVFIRVYSW